jgi:transposase
MRTTKELSGPRNQFHAFPRTLTIGIDLGDRFGHYCILDQKGVVVEEGRVKMTRKEVTVHFQRLAAARIAMEAGTHSGWVSRLLESFGHEVLVANVCETPGISHSHRKSDPVDAEKLARYARVDPRLLSPIRHRTEEAQHDLVLIRVRERFIAARTMFINAARGIVKSLGYRLPGCGADTFAKRCRLHLPARVADILAPLLNQVASLTEQIKQYDALIEQLAESKYPETLVLQGVSGVGALTALSYVLTLGDPTRFTKSRDVGCYLGLRPRRSQSGQHDPQLGITKAGNRYLRKTLVQCAQHILGPLGRDSALRRWGQRLAARGGKNAKKRAIVAMARKLAVLLHRLWVTQKPYDPFYGVSQEPNPAAA